MPSIETKITVNDVQDAIIEFGCAIERLAPLIDNITDTLHDDIACGSLDIPAAIRNAASDAWLLSLTIRGQFTYLRELSNATERAHMGERALAKSGSPFSPEDRYADARRDPAIRGEDGSAWASASSQVDLLREERDQHQTDSAEFSALDTRLMAAMTGALTVTAPNATAFAQKVAMMRDIAEGMEFPQAWLDHLIADVRQIESRRA